MARRRKIHFVQDGKTDLKYKRWKDRTREGCRQAREQTGN